MPKPKANHYKAIGGLVDGKWFEDTDSDVLVIDATPLGSVFDRPDSDGGSMAMMHTTEYRKVRWGMGNYRTYIWLHQSFTMEDALKRLITHYRPNDKSRSRCPLTGKRGKRLANITN